MKAYQQIFNELNKTEIQWLQLDELILGLELPFQWLVAFQESYQQFSKGSLKFLLTTYFSSVDAVIETIVNLNVDGLDIDIVSKKTDSLTIIEKIPDHWVVSLRVIDGRNIWEYRLLDERLWLAPSYSLLHSPVDLVQEDLLDSDIKSWLVFARQKCQELALLKQALTDQSTATIKQYSCVVHLRTTSFKCQDQFVQASINNLQKDSFNRQENFAQRKLAQQHVLKLPLYPTKTIGSFPQTSNIRQQRSLWRQNKISLAQYTEFIKQQIKTTIEKQEALDLDVLVHAEAERNDMVEYFAEQLNGGP